MRYLILGAIALTGIAAAQDAPAGWKIVKDRQNVCQFTVPNDWSDRKGSAVAHGQRAGMSFQDAVALAKQVMPPTKVFEESATRVWYAVARGNGKPGQSWYVAVPGPQVCTATIDFDNDSMEADAKKIVLSLRPAK